MESYGHGLVGYNMMMAELNHCLFHHNYWRPWIDSVCITSHATNNGLLDFKAGGNDLFVFTDDSMSHFHKSTIRTLSILHSEFAHGRNQHERMTMHQNLEVVV